MPLQHSTRYICIHCQNMDNQLKDHIRNTLNMKIPEEELDRFVGLFFHKEVDKKHLLAMAGKRVGYLNFIVKGSAYAYYTNEKGEDYVMQFALEGYWITAMYSFFSGNPSFLSVETLEPTEMLVLSREKYEQAMNEFSFADRYFRILLQNAFVAQQYRLAKTNSEEADQRYLEFSRLYPHFVQRIPQYLIASYLGIKPQSLSRIRQKIAASARKK